MTLIGSAPVRAITLLGLLSGCTVDVRDRTADLYYNPPANRQTLRVEVQSSRPVLDVHVEPEELVRRRMTPDPASAGDYVTEANFPPCTAVVAYRVDVVIDEGTRLRTRSFPRAGRFTHQIAGRPDDCATASAGEPRTFVVDRTADFVDRNPGDGICRGGPAANPGCSLRAAVMEANAWPGADLIRLPAGRFLRTRDGGEDPDELDARVRDLDVTESVTIEGISGTRLSVTDFLYWVHDDGDADSTGARANAIWGLEDDPMDATFAKIDAAGIDRVFQVAPGAVLRLRNLALLNGSTAWSGGGIHNDGTLTLERVAVVESRASTASDSADRGGGGIYNRGTLDAEDVLLARNRSTTARGGALYNRGSATIRRGLIAHNVAPFGAALQNTGTLSIENTTVHGNPGGYPGRHASHDFSSIVENSDGGRLDLAFTTLSGHEGSDSRPDRPLLFNSSGRTTVRNSLFVYNLYVRYCSGSIESLGGNVIAAACTLTGSLGRLDSIGVQPNVYPFRLYDHGGFTPVFALEPGGPDYFFNPRGRAIMPPFPFTDQRGDGFPRQRGDIPEGGTTERADPGAFEFQPGTLLSAPRVATR